MASEPGGRNDRIATQLPRAAAHRDRSTCERTVDRFSLDLAVFWHGDGVHSFKDLKTGLFSYQVHALSVMLEMTDRLGGGILADGTGLGKTLEAIALILYRAAEGDIIREAATGGWEGHARAIPCPRGPDRLKCPCASDLPQDARGATLVVCPRNVLCNWVREFQTHVEPGCLSIRVWTAELEAAGLSRDVGLGLKEMEALALQQDIDRNPPHRQVVLVNGESLPAFLSLVNDTRGKLARTASNAKKDIEKAGMWSLIIVDEAHKVYCGQSQRLASLRDCTEGGAKFWCLSATMVDGDIKRLKSFLPMINRTGLPSLSTRRIGRLLTDDSDLYEGLELATILQQAAKAWAECAIQRKPSDIWIDGRPILKTPAVKEFTQIIRGRAGEDTLRQMPTEIQREVARMVASIGGSHLLGLTDINDLDGIRGGRDYMIEASFPGITATRRRLGLDKARVTGEFDSSLTQTIAVWKPEIAELAASSPKVRWILDHLNSLGTDPIGRPRKIIILSQRPFNIFFLWLYLTEHTHLKSSVVWQGEPGGQSKASRYFDEKLQSSTNARKRIYLGTIGKSGEGINLHRADEMILMEPCTSLTSHRQAIGRISRIGSRYDEVSVHVLATASYEMDHMRLLRKRAERTVSIEDGTASSNRSVWRRSASVQGASNH